MSRRKRTIALDFDGVLHRYNGWQEGKIDGPIPGARQAVLDLQRRGHEVVVFSTRDSGVIRRWLHEHGFPAMEVTNTKQPFYVIVDDRAVRFDGEWTPKVLRDIQAFEPYWVKARDDNQMPVKEKEPTNPDT